jgi:hypothetical protein
MLKLSSFVQRFRPNHRDVTFLELSNILHQKLLKNNHWMSLDGEDGLKILLNKEILKINNLIEIKNRFYKQNNPKLNLVDRDFLEQVLLVLVEQHWFESRLSQEEFYYRRKSRLLKGFTGPQASSLVYS